MEQILIVAGAVTLTTILIVASIGGMVAYELQFSPRARLRRRVELIINPDAEDPKKKEKGKKGGGATAHRKMVQQRLKEMKAQQKKSKRRGVIKSKIQAAGLDLPVGHFYLASVAVGIVTLVVYLVLGFEPLAAPLVAVPVGYFVPIALLGFLGKRRQQRFTDQFADAIDVVVRGIQSGLPISECMAVIGRESPEPIATEFRMITEGQRLGLTLEEALDRAVLRMPTPELKFFAIVMNINQQTGGNLAETLQNLSRVLRGRKELADLIKVKSSEAKSTAMIIGSLPFCICGLLLIISPDYIMLLFTEQLGNYMLYGSAALMTCGALVMKSMINFKM